MTEKIKKEFKKEEMPPEHLRKLIKEYQRNMQKRNSKYCLQALRFLPHALQNLLRSMPMPWESIRYVKVLYHIRGTITFVDDKRKVDIDEYITRWGDCYKKMRAEKKLRSHFQRIRFPIFDDEEMPLDYGENFLGIIPPNGLGEYEPNNAFKLNLSANQNYLFTPEDFITAKTLNLNIPGGPKYEKLDTPDDILFVKKPEHKLAYPFLYSNKKNKIYLSAYQNPINFLCLHKIQINSTNLMKDKRAIAPYLSEINCDGSEIKERRMTAPENIPLIKNWYTNQCPPFAPKKVKLAYQRLIKDTTENEDRKKLTKRKNKIFKKLKNTKYFQTTELDWLEAGLQLVLQGHTMLNEILRRKKITYLTLDYNFNLKPIRTLTTKERKKSRLGSSFHLIRELLKFIKLIVDSHAKYRLRHIDEFQLADGLNYIFTHVGHLTGIYRYKYRIMRQIKKCKSLKHIIYHRFNEDIGKGPGCGFWAPSWRIWIFFFRGHISLIENYISNLVTRMNEGREYSAKGVTKQRIESHYDLEIRNRLISEIKSIIPENITSSRLNTILLHLSEAWKCWKANIPWNVPGMPEPITRLITKFINEKADWYINNTIYIRNRIRADKTVDKAVAKKNLGRITRLYLKEEATRQERYLEDGPNIEVDHALKMYNLMKEYLEKRKITKILFPDNEKYGEKHDHELLLLALEKLKETHSNKVRTNLAQREELTFIEEASDNPEETLIRIKKSLLTQRTFKEVNILLKDNYNTAHTVYEVDPIEKITDAYLDQYLSYESDKRNLFPNFIKPRDDELASQTVYNYLNDISKIIDNTSILECKMERIPENIDLNLLSKLLNLILDPILTEYIISKNNVMISYKDLQYNNNVGAIRGLEFYSFIYLFYTLGLDLMLLGVDKVMELIDGYCNKDDDIIHYMRYLDNIYVLFNHNKLTSDVLMSKFYERSPLVVYSLINVSTNTFSLCDFNVLISKHKLEKESFWRINNSFYAYITVSKEGIRKFRNRIEQIISSGGGSTFFKTINRWNIALLSLVTYYREAIIDSEELLNTIAKLEVKVQNVIKMGLNSKMPIRFPPVVFYSPKELGGLGMLSMSSVTVWDGDNTANASTKMIPNLLPYITPWETEFTDSREAYREYVLLKQKKGLDHIKPLFNRGLPRISTLYHRDRTILKYDKGYRIRNIFKKFSNYKSNQFYFTCAKHDGKLWKIDNYRDDVIEALGGIDSILKHTLFQSTYFNNWEGLFWEQSSKYEESMKCKKLTNAQRTGLNQIPNRRFTLWWSPTINRANVYVGFQVQLDLTGVLMHGKLPTIKISFIQIFRGHLWQKIHESIVLDIMDGLAERNTGNSIKDRIKTSGRSSITIHKLAVHPRKSYKLNAGGADLLLKGEFIVGPPKLLGSNIAGPEKRVNELWIDIQLRWGDYDSHDSRKYAKMKYLDYTTDPLSFYPSDSGIILVIDLCYNTYSAFGCIPKDLDGKLCALMDHIMKANVSLQILRERIRKALQLYSTQIEISSTYSDLFSSGLIVDNSLVYRGKSDNGALFVLNPKKGILYIRVINYSLFTGKKKMAQRIRNISAEGTAEILKIAGDVDSITVVGRNMAETMELYMIDHPDTKLKGTELELPFGEFINFKRVTKDLNEEEITKVELYKEWNKYISPYTCFCRLMLILRAMTVDRNEVKNLFGDCELWPDFDDEEWIDIELRLRDIVINNYCLIHKLNPKLLTQSEIRDIIFGSHIDHIQEKAELIEKKTFTFKGINKIGDEIVSTTWSRYGAIECKISEWRERYLIYEEKIEEVINNITNLNLNDTLNFTFKVPFDLVKMFYVISDIKTKIFALIVLNNEISFALLPQYCSGDKIRSPRKIPENIKEQIIGIVILNGDDIVEEELMMKYDINDGIVLRLSGDGEVSVYRNGIAGCVEYGGEGCYLIPEVWNYNFNRNYFNEEIDYSLKVGVPKRYFDGEHRMKHFINFSMI
ncbi:Pre-mRNA-splicing factor 8 like protein [Astathelohania contejeani]|uniref:Pre-mRNA-splicing factor 8 like protein n=1 Tax=Astathelohania contejeani TaxID=164912 RepID=A0ABQ7I130_9MICR|nr:Pre-mRNA-splicing factor 8 like protein [Thelohania contejeani]